MNIPILNKEKSELVTRMQKAHEEDRSEDFAELREKVEAINKKIDQQSYLDEQSVASVKHDECDSKRSAEVRTKYNLSKALRHTLKGGWDGIEQEVQQELRSQPGADKHPENAVLIPDETFNSGYEQRAVTATGTSTNVSTESFRPMEFLPVLRNRTIAGSLGMRMIQGTGDKVRIPKQGAETLASWQTEVGAVSNTDMTFVAPVEFEPHRLSYMTSHSDQVVRESAGGLNITQLIVDEGSRAMSQAVDNAIFATNGTSQPVTTQIPNAPEQLWKVGTIGSINRLARTGDTNGKALTDGVAYDELLSLIGSQQDANQPGMRPGFAINYPTYRKLKTVRRLASSTDNVTIIPAGSMMIDGMPTQTSQIVTGTFKRGTKDCSVIFYSSDWQYLVLCAWGPQASLLVDQYSLAHQSTVRLIWHSFLDFKILRDEAFSWYDSILLS